MIQITLNFATVEAARAALLEIPVTALAPTPAEVAAPKSAPAPAPAVGQATAKESAAPKKTAAAPAPAAPSAETPAPASTAADVDYPTLQKAVLTLAGKSREAAMSTAAAFGVKTFKELPKDQWAAALVAVNDKIAELEAA